MSKLGGVLIGVDLAWLGGIRWPLSHVFQLPRCLWGDGTDLAFLYCGSCNLLKVAEKGKFLNLQVLSRKTQVFEFLLVSCLLLSSWSKQVKWPSTQSA